MHLPPWEGALAAVPHPCAGPAHGRGLVRRAPARRLIREEGVMQEDRYARYGAGAGIVFLILLVVGFFIYGADIPEPDAAAEEWATWYSDNTGQIQTAVTLVGVSLFFFIWFLGSLRSALAVAEGGTGRLSSVAYGGGLVAAGFFLVFLTAVAAAALHADEVDPFVIQGLNDLGIVAAAPAAAAFTALFAATAIVGYRHAA